MANPPSSIPSPAASGGRPGLITALSDLLPMASSAPALASNGRQCPKCGAPVSPGTSNCANCGTILPTTRDLAPLPNAPGAPAAAPIPPDADQFFIMIWGPSSAGKTMLLFMLRDEIRLKSTEWDISVVGDAATDFWEGLTDIKYDHHFSQATALTENDEMIFQFSRREPRLNSVIHRYVLVQDIAGEWFENRKLAIGTDGKNVVDEHLIKSKGFLCLIDPNRKSEETSKHFDKLLMRLQALCGKPTDKRLALCLTKMDDRRYRHRLADRKAFIREIVGDRVSVEIDLTFHPDKVNYFASSAIGFYPGAVPLRSNSGIDWQGRGIIYEIQNIKPFGLVQPLCNWLFLD